MTQQKRKHNISVWLDQEDFELIKEVVDYQRGTLSDYCRRKVMSAGLKDRSIMLAGGDF